MATSTWIHPVGEESGDWTNPQLSYDGDTGTGATCSNIAFRLVPYPSSPIQCSKVRIYCDDNSGGQATLEIEVYYSDAYHSIHDGFLTASTWVELPIGSTETISKARINLNLGGSSVARVFEFEFERITADPISGSYVNTYYY